MSFTDQLKKVKQAAAQLALATPARREKFLVAFAQALQRHAVPIAQANAKDVVAGMQRGDAPSLLDRLRFDKARIAGSAKDLGAVRRLVDPTNHLLERRQIGAGLWLERRTVPLGVVGIIYEARPNVTVDVIGLCIKSGNAVVLRGSASAYHTNLALVRIAHAVLRRVGLPVDAIFLVDPRDRKLAQAMLQAEGLIDVVIPRGSKRLIDFAKKTATVPVIETGAGVCHTFVEKSSDPEMAAKIVENAKVQRPSVCNALDTLVVEKGVTQSFWEKTARRLAKHGVELRCDPASFRAFAKLRGRVPHLVIKKAKPQDFGHEFLALICSVKTVGSFGEGLRFVQQHTSGHSEAIITRQRRLAERFLREVDATSVYWNASTRFTDGGMFGLGAEMGISTQKLHARGPFALEALTTYKWIVRGRGNVRK